MLENRQFLSQQLLGSPNYQPKCEHTQLLKKQSTDRYHNLISICKTQQEQITLRQIETQEYKDTLTFDKLILEQSLSQEMGRLKIVGIEKQDSLVSCDSYESRLSQISKKNKELITIKHSLQNEASSLKMQIAQNKGIAVLSQQQCTQLCRKCEENLEIIEEQKIQSHYKQLNADLSSVASSNMQLVSTLKDKHIQAKRYQEALGSQQHEGHLIRLITQLEKNQAKQQQIMEKIKAEEILRNSLQSRLFLLSKIESLREMLIKKQTQQSEQLGQSILALSEENAVLAKKLKVFQELELQMASSQQILREGLKGQETQSLKWLRQMGVTSERFNKKLDARQLMSERRALVDQYKSSLLTVAALQPHP